MDVSSSAEDPSPTGGGAAGINVEDRRLGDLRVHVAQPDDRTGAAILLLPTIFGLTDVMRGFARDIAGAGMTAVVWDPYDGRDAVDDVPQALALSKQRDDPGVVRDLKLIVDHMHAGLGCGSIGTIGWCFGGRLALVHAGSDDRVRAVSAYNPTIWPTTPVEVGGVLMSRADHPGQTLDEFALAAAIRAPVQVSRPQNDLTQPGEYERLLDALLAREDLTTYDYHPGADHGFSYSPGEANARAHRFAWAATIALLSTSLKGA